MATGQRQVESYHACSCGEQFDSTQSLLEHAREVHGLRVY